MHTTENLTRSSFAIALEGRRADLRDIFPGFGERDRLGVVVRSPCGAVGASALILATVTAFYDIQRRRAADFFVYPDYYLFHVGGSLGDHRMLDIFPSHKEVVVEDDSEVILRAINDRAVTRLLVEDISPSDPELERATLASAGIRTAIAYSPEGRVAEPGLVVAGDEVTEGYVRDVLDQSGDIESGVRDDIRAGRASLLEGGAPVETYRRLAVGDALQRL